MCAMNRKEFILSGAGAFFIASAGKAFGADAPSNRVRLALVGCREKGRGAAVVQRALQVPGVEIAYVCDVDSRAMDYAADLVEKKSNGASRPKKEKDLRKILADKSVDGILSETPDHFHAWSAVMAMRAGKAVYVEKPCAFCPREGEIILDTWRKTGMVFQQGSQRRSSVPFRIAAELVRKGELIGKPTWGKTWYMTHRAPIGKGQPVAVPEWLDWDLWQGPAPRVAYRDNIVHYNWHWFRNWGTGECGNNAVHFVDVARWCLGADWPCRVSSTGGKYWMPPDADWEWPDTQTATWDFPDGKFITWEGLCCVNQKPYMNVSTGAMVYGTDGAAFFGPGGGVEIFDKKGKSVKKWNTAGKTVLTNTDDRSGGGWADTTREHLENFVDCIRAKTPEKAYANAEIGVKSTFLALTANVSYFCGKAIDIDPKTGALLTKEGASLWQREYEKGWELV